MGKCFIRLGSFNKKLIVPLFLAILSILHIFYINYILDNKGNVIITELSSSIGHISIIIVPYLKCFSNKHKKIKYQKIKKNYLKDYSIFLSTHLINLLLLYACSQLKPEANNTRNILFLASDVHKIYSIGSFEVIFSVIMSLIHLKDKYFIHHYLSLFIFIGISIAIDFILDNFKYDLTSKLYLYIAAFIGQLFIESTNLVYQKYMFDTLYYSPYRTCFAFGILFLVYNLGTIAVFELNNDDEYIDYFNDIKIGYEVFKFISNIFMVFFLYIFMALTNFYFSPNHVIVNDMIANMFIFLFKSDSKIKYYAIILFVFQFILLMIFLELLELDFCGLNENTKKNIQSRASLDMQNIEKVDDRETLAEVSGYIFEDNNRNSTKKQSSNIEKTDTDKNQMLMEMKITPNEDD